MLRVVTIALTLQAGLTNAALADHSTVETAERRALETLDAFMAAFNAGDAQQWAATLNYPHVRIASAAVRVSPNAEEYAGRFSFDDFRRRTGWHHSAWDKKKIVQSSADKVHIIVQFTRYRADDSKIASYRSLYVVTNDNGHWGVQARSSFAP